MFLFVCRNVYLFDEGLASRVPYESAARVLPQSKRSFAGYVVRQGLAIAMEHNFMASAAGRENFKNQLQQVSAIVCVCIRVLCAD